MTRELVTLVLPLTLLAQAACLHRAAPPARDVAPVDVAPVGIAPVRAAPGGAVAAGPVADHCPGRRVARVGVSAGVGAAGGWLISWVLERFYDGENAHRDPGVRRIRRSLTISLATVGAVMGVVDALREPCDVLPWNTRRTARRRPPPAPPPSAPPSTAPLPSASLLPAPLPSASLLPAPAPYAPTAGWSRVAHPRGG